MPDDTEPQSRPVPPEKPLPTDCCGSGCAVCVLDAYADALELYELELARWMSANPESQQGS